MTTNTTKLFRPLPLGPCPLQHRIVMAPMARFRADAHHVPTPVMADYYAQRACVPGTLLISEANLVSPRAGGQAFGPGIWTAAQLDGWRRVTDAVHARGCYIWAQLFALGRSASAAPAEADEGVDGFVSPSAMPVEEGGRAPRELREDEVWTFVGEFAEATRGAVERAGFDGVEIHGANGWVWGVWCNVWMAADFGADTLLISSRRILSIVGWIYGAVPLRSGRDLRWMLRRLWRRLLDRKGLASA